MYANLRACSSETCHHKARTVAKALLRCCLLGEAPLSMIILQLLRKIIPHSSEQDARYEVPFMSITQMWSNKYEQLNNNNNQCLKKNTVPKRNNENKKTLNNSQVRQSMNKPD